VFSAQEQKQSAPTRVSARSVCGSQPLGCVEKRYPLKTRAQKSKIEKPAARELLTAGVVRLFITDLIKNT
jgi:hypothetical protein